jgi:hypothetical protein
VTLAIAPTQISFSRPPFYEVQTLSEKSAKKSESIPFLTPWFTARYPKISSPDIKGKYADNKFKTDGILDEGDIEKVRATLQAAAEKLHPGIDDVQLPLKEFFSDKEKTKSEGWGLVLKSQYKPAVFDAKRKHLPDGVKIGGGSVVRVASAIFPWEKTEKMQIVENGKKRTETVTAYGIGLRLGDVQVRELVERQGQGDGSAFDEVEGGFEYESDGSEQFDGGDDATSL